MSYSAQTIGRAISAGVVAAFGAATAGANGVDLASLDLGQWLGVIATGLFTGGAVLHDPTGKVVNQIHAKKDSAAKKVDAIEDLTSAIISQIRLGK